MAAAPQAPEIYTAASEFWTGVEIAYPGATAATADVLQMLTPPLSVPSTDWGLAVVLGVQAYQWYEEQ